MMEKTGEFEKLYTNNFQLEGVISFHKTKHVLAH